MALRVSPFARRAPRCLLHGRQAIPGSLHLGNAHEGRVRDDPAIDLVANPGLPGGEVRCLGAPHDFMERLTPAAERHVNSIGIPR